MVPLKPCLAVIALVAIALSGCVEPGDEVTPPGGEGPRAGCVAEGACGSAAVGEDGRDLRLDLRANDTLPAPTWEVGDVFEQHLYYGSADTQGEHIKTMVVSDTGDCYQVATTSEQAARTDAVFDLPILGCVEKENIGTSGFGVGWDWMYQFPLEEGKSWRGGVDWIFNWNQNTFHSYQFELTVSYAPQIDAFGAIFPGFQITGTTAEGEVLLEYDYVPAVGWFAHFYMYDLSTEDANDFMFHAMSMGTSERWTGSYLIDETETAIEGFFIPGFSTLVGEDLPLQFTVEEGATYLKGVIVPIACPGAVKVILVSPSGSQSEYDHQYADPSCAEMFTGIITGDDGEEPAPGTYAVHWYDEPAEAGDWNIAPIAAGFAGFFIWLEAVTEVSYELTASDLPAQDTD